MKKCIDWRELNPIEVFGESIGEIQQNNTNTIPRATERSVIIFMTFAQQNVREAPRNSSARPVELRSTFKAQDRRLSGATTRRSRHSLLSSTRENFQIWLRTYKQLNIMSMRNGRKRQREYISKVHVVRKISGKVRNKQVD